MDLGRLVNGERKINNPKPENAGSLLIFCEGSTEYNYLSYFKLYLEHNLKAHYSNIPESVKFKLHDSLKSL